MERNGCEIATRGGFWPDGDGLSSWGRKGGCDLGSALGMEPYFWSSNGLEAGWNSHHDGPHILNSCFSWSVGGSIFLVQRLRGQAGFSWS